jgi:hypothetical protein
VTSTKSPRRILLWAAVLALLVAGAGWLWQAAPVENPPAERPDRPAPASAIDHYSSPGSTEAAPALGPDEPEAAESRPAPEAKARAPAAAPSQQRKGSPPSDPSGTPVAEATGEDTAGRSAASGPAEDPVVAVAVVGREGELLFGPAEVSIAPDNPWGATALGALEATGLPYQLSARFPELVEAVAGQRNQGASGWMYQVNGEVPMAPAGKKTVAPGDRIIWWYSRDLGQAPPTWEELIAKD